MTRKKLFAVLVIIALLAMVQVAMEAKEAELPETPCEALEMLGTAPVIQIGIGAFTALLLEYWPAWKGLPSKSKRPIVFGFCLVVPVLALLGRAGLCGAEVNLQTLYEAALVGGVAFVTSQFVHIKQLP